MYRLSIPNEQLSDAEDTLNEAMIPFDFDSGNRLLIEEDYIDETIEALNTAEIDYDEI